MQHDGAADESFVRINKDKQVKIAQLDASVAANKAEVCCRFQLLYFLCDDCAAFCFVKLFGARCRCDLIGG
jgi:hypothetical protein